VEAVTTTAELGSDLVTYAARLVRAVRHDNDLPAGVRVLSLLDEHGAVGVSALAEIDRCSQPTMSAVVAGIVERGWVEKRPHPDDGRSTVVTLTRAGRAELRRVRRATGDTVAARLAGRPEPTTEQLATAVAVLRAVLEPVPEGATAP
jgi:DNA-binding MarR family transcriptional regulator